MSALLTAFAKHLSDPRYRAEFERVRVLESDKAGAGAAPPIPLDSNKTGASQNG